MENPNFLKNKYNLHNAPEVEKAAKRTEIRKGEQVKQSPADLIQNYLDRFKKIVERKDPKDREMGVEALKKVLLDKFVTKFEDIPESWHNFNERVIRERGQGGDWNQYSKEQKDKERRQQAEAVLEDQKASLEQWIDYLSSEDSSYMPDYIKYWTFRSITDLAEFDKEKSEFPKRSQGTVKMFPDINQEALSYVIDAVVKKHEGENFSFEEFNYDLSEEQKNAFTKSLNTENFAKLYSWANEQIHPIAKHLLPITDGEWIKYKQDDEDSENYKLLNQSIRGRGTGWCTAGEKTAKTQLKGGDFYCYYTKDDDGKSNIPRIAIRMENNKIAEVRGIAYKQNLDEYMGDVLAEKLDEFPDKAEYLKKDHDMKKLTEIDNKVKVNQGLNKADLVFLYEIESPIEGFGYQRDPRIKELIQTRNPKEDAPIVFDCSPEQIAHSLNEVNKNTKAYIGELELDIFKKLPENLEHIYTSFPEGKIERLEMTIGNRNKSQIIKELEKRSKLKDNDEEKIYISSYAQSMLNNSEFATVKKSEQINLVKLKVSALGFKNNAKTDEVYKRAKELGLELCPLEVGPTIRLDYKKIFKKDQPKENYFRIAMKQITDSDGNPSVFYVSRNDDGERWLNNDWAGPGSGWCPRHGFLFRYRPASKA